MHESIPARTEDAAPLAEPARIGVSPHPRASRKHEGREGIATGTSTRRAGGRPARGRSILVGLVAGLLCCGAASGLPAQEAAKGEVAISGGAGIFRFLNETTGGAVVHATLDRGRSVEPDFALWLASPGDLLGALDASLMTPLRPEGISVFFRIGVGALFGRDLIGPGFVIGCGIASRRGAAPRLRVDGLFHWYVPRGGVPVVSLTAAITP
jgi:hypothetical protein